MRRIIYNIISVVFTSIKFAVIKIFHFKTFHYKGIQRFSPNTEVIISGGKSRLTLGEKVRVHRRSKISVSNGGNLVLGDNVALGNGVSLYCFDSIEIGDYTELGQDTKIYDHDHDFRVPGGYKERKFKTRSVKIGKNTWIGCNVVILRGTIIGDNCVVGAGCILNGEYPDNTIIVQKRFTQEIKYTFVEGNDKNA